MPIIYGRIYVARPDLHLLVEAEHIRVVFGSKENRLRPGIDPLFRSAAGAHGSHVIGVLLSGGLDDGVAGLWDVHCCGGVTIVQDPVSARFPALIHHAMAAMTVDHVAAPHDIPGILTRLSMTPPSSGNIVPAERERIEVENTIETRPGDFVEKLERIGELSAYSCPGCGGPLWRLSTGPVERYRCRVGHAYSGARLFQSCWEISERTLYSALQMLEENAQIGRRKLEATTKNGQPAPPELLEQVLRLEKERRAPISGATHHTLYDCNYDRTFSMVAFNIDGLHGLIK
jgi:two-component system, chemotaxis family, protein-glutamate methylesterase/glutaminase